MKRLMLTTKSVKTLIFASISLTSLVLMGGGGILASGFTNPASATTDSANSTNLGYDHAFSYTKLNAEIAPVLTLYAPSSCILSEAGKDPTTPEGSIITPTPEGTFATCHYKVIDPDTEKATIKDGADVIVSTNNSTGYQLYINMIGTSTTNNNALNHTNTTLTPKPTIPSLTDYATVAEFPSNHWGYYAIPMNHNTINPTATETVYNPLPGPIGTDPSKPATTGHLINSKEAMAVKDTTMINFATKVDSSQVGGTYSNTVLYTAIANAVPQPTTYTVHYDKNGGQNVPQDQEYTTTDPMETSHEFQLTDPSPADIPFRPGYTFGGYTTVQPDPDKGIDNKAGAYSPGSQIYLTKTKPEVTLYAIWIPNSEIGFNNSGITTMQEMTPEICNQAPMYTEGKLQDTRDYKVYSVVKLRTTKDSDEGGQCWMNQNLSLEIRADKTYTPADTNIAAGTEWKPGESQSASKSTIPAGKLNFSTWQDDINHPYSYNPGDDYFTTSGRTANDPETDNGNYHYAAGNYYNWSAAKASNNTSGQTSPSTSNNYDICPKGWNLPDVKSSPSDFGRMLYAQHIINNITSYYEKNGFNLIRTAPIYWNRIGDIRNGVLKETGFDGAYWSSTTKLADKTYGANFGYNYIYPPYNEGYDRFIGISARCLIEKTTITPSVPDSSPNLLNGGDDSNFNNNPLYIDNNANSDIDSNSYSDPKGARDTGLKHLIENGGPNWFLFILLLVLAILTLGISLFIFYRKNKKEKQAEID